MNPHEHVPLDFKRIQPAEQISASREFLGRMASRRSVRFFASEPRTLLPARLRRKVRRTLMIRRTHKRQQKNEYS